MKYLTKLLLCAVLMAALVSCIESQPSSATFSQGVAFEMDEFTFSDHFKDSLMFLPQISFDQLIYFNTSCDGENQGYKGGFKISALKGGPETPDDIAVFTSADKSAGINGSFFYAGFLRAPNMPDYDITLNLSQFTTADAKIVGFCLCNSLYNSRLAKEGLIAPGDYLKLVVEFYNNNTLVNSFEKYLVDYTGSDLKMLNEWTEWDISSEASKSSVQIASFKDSRLKLEVKGENLKPCFCLDNYLITAAVTY